MLLASANRRIRHASLMLPQASAAKRKSVSRGPKNLSLPAELRARLALASEATGIPENPRRPGPAPVKAGGELAAQLAVRPPGLAAGRREARRALDGERFARAARAVHGPALARRAAGRRSSGPRGYRIHALLRAQRRGAKGPRYGRIDVTLRKTRSYR
jgi:hypothetical protein